MLEVTLREDAYTKFRAAVRTFVSAEVLPHALTWEQDRKLPDARILRQMGSVGFLGISLPKEQGGHGKDFLHEVVLAEELARSHALGWALSVLVQSNVVPHILADFGTGEQLSLLRSSVQGEGYTALAVTERRCGSDLLRAQTSATSVRDAYVLRGEKCYITNGSIATHLLVLARTSTEVGPWSHSLFLVPGDTEGVSRQRLRTTGFKTSDTAVVSLNSVSIPRTALVGGEGKAFIYLLKGLQRERLLGGCALVSLATHALAEVALEHTQRERFGSSLSHKQALAHRLVDLRTELEAAKALVYRAVEKYIACEPVDEDIAMVKLHVYGTVQRVVRECAQLLGAEVFVEDHWLAHAAQDVQAITIAAGTSEIMRELLTGMHNHK